MAKADFCFTYYDGDAARDMAHMNRLERGAYTDIIISQRKFGHLTLEQIKKILGRDFDECFPAIELVMLKDEDGKYYIEWLEKSTRDSKKHSKKQSDNIAKRYNKGDENLPTNYQTSTNDLPKDDLEIPLGDGDGNGSKTGTKSSVENPIGSKKVQKIANEVWKDNIWKESICMGHQLKPPELKQWMAQFNSSISNDCIAGFGESSYKKIFGGWLNRQRSKNYKLPETPASTKSQLRTINANET